jgi:hypothetical protein
VKRKTRRSNALFSTPKSIVHLVQVSREELIVLVGIKVVFVFVCRSRVVCAFMLLLYAMFFWTLTNIELVISV